MVIIDVRIVRFRGALELLRVVRIVRVVERSVSDLAWGGRSFATDLESIYITAALAVSAQRIFLVE